jgi:hypothetical protein
MTPSPDLIAQLRRLGRISLTVAGGGGVGCAIGYWQFRGQFDPAYLTAFVYWLGMSLGCLAIAMIHGMTGGGWGRTIRRVIEAGYETLPLMALLFVPVWLGATRIYPWTDPDFVQHHLALVRKSGYLNLEGFRLRAIAFFAIWIITTWAIGRLSPNSERDPDSDRSRRLQRVSGLGFIAFGFSFTLAAVDWMMSLEPLWYSTMYALIQIAGQAVSGLSFAVIVVTGLRMFKPWSRTVTPARLNDLGSMLLASVMFWAYCSFFQFLVVWSGNLPEENIWYLHRSQGGWQYLVFSLITLHFGIPFFLLLSRRLKRDPTSLARIAALLLVMRYVDLYWTIVPGFQQENTHDQGVTLPWFDLPALMLIGGLWLAVFSWRLSIRIRLPIHDPELTEDVR